MDGINNISTDDIKVENKQQIQEIIEKQDVKNVEKVINLMESLGRMKDLDKVISTVEEINKKEENINKDEEILNKKEENINKNILNIDTPKINEDTIIEEKKIIKEGKKIDMEKIIDFD
jgi:hypothetical protein